MSIEPSRLIVAAQREVMADITSSSGTITEPRQQWLFHIQNLATRIDPSRSRATLACGLLEILMPNAGVAHREIGMPPRTSLGSGLRVVRSRSSVTNGFAAGRVS